MIYSHTLTRIRHLRVSVSGARGIKIDHIPKLWLRGEDRVTVWHKIDVSAVAKLGTAIAGNDKTHEHRLASNFGGYTFTP